MLTPKIYRVFKQVTVTAGGLFFPSIIAPLDTLHEACDMSPQHLFGRPTSIHFVLLVFVPKKKS